MLEVEKLQLFANYNRLMNRRLISASSQLSDRQYHEDRGAYFKSVAGTLNHILVGDIIWLNRFARGAPENPAFSGLSSFPQPEFLNSILYPDLAEFDDARESMDRLIIDWTCQLSESELSSIIDYRDTAGSPHSKLYGQLINHLFLHQVHHRGQVTTLISQFAVDFGETDFLELLPEISS